MEAYLTPINDFYGTFYCLTLEAESPDDAERIRKFVQYIGSDHGSIACAGISMVVVENYGYRFTISKPKK